MNGSGTIRVAKRDGTFEQFDREKLAAAICRVMQEYPCAFAESREVALAIDIYLHRRRWGTISSAAIFEMLLKTFRRIGMDLPAAIIETHQTWRLRRRKRVKVRYADGQTTEWDKGWLVKSVCSSWHLGRSAGRILAAEIEARLLGADVSVIERDKLIEQVNALVSEYGLADAVPVESHSLET
ncbi:MAG: hypothetical protein GY794_09045 [bacterium]|nr:hypothetical protein [bacterium]